MCLRYEMAQSGHVPHQSVIQCGERETGTNCVNSCYIKDFRWVFPLGAVQTNWFTLLAWHANINGLPLVANEEMKG